MSDRLTVPASDLRPGDLVIFLGRSHRVLRLAEYVHELVTAGKPWISVVCEEGWNMTLHPGSTVEISGAAGIMTDRAPADPIIVALRLALREVAARRAAGLDGRGKIEPTPIAKRRRVA